MSITAIGIESIVNVKTHNTAVTINEEEMVILSKFPLSYLSAIEPAHTLSNKIGTSRQKLTNPR